MGFKRKIKINLEASNDSGKKEEQEEEGGE